MVQKAIYTIEGRKVKSYDTRADLYHARRERENNKKFLLGSIKKIMPKKEYTSLPTDYPVCEHSCCPMATTCLHQIAYSILMEQHEEYLRLINPTDAAKTRPALTIGIKSRSYSPKDSPTFKSECTLNNIISL